MMDEQMKDRQAKASGKVLAVDDDPLVLELLTALLKRSGYEILACENAAKAFEEFQKGNFDVVLTDIKMPGISGLDLLDKIRSVNPDMPVILITAYAEIEVAVDAIRRGAFDFLIKPFKQADLLSAVERSLRYDRLVSIEKDYKYMLEDTVRKRTKELAGALSVAKGLSRELIIKLTTAAEFRDKETGAHIMRIGLYANKIAEFLDMPADFVDTVTLTAPMHDIGKIGIPDNILFKPGPLNKEEFERMKSHTRIGWNILSGSENPTIKMAAQIALSHHERWDGSGYPQGLKGEDIPMVGRIVMLADQYDALMSNRPYKAAFGHEKAFSVITKGDGRTEPYHFDPKVMKAFKEVAPVFMEIFETNAG